MHNNGITVIIPTYNRRDLLNKTLLSLCFQSFHINNYEVIVIDDGSTDDTQEIVLSFKDRIFISYFYQNDEGFRVARARNIGIKNAKFNICLFLDSGVIASGSLLENHWLAHQNRNELALIGYAYGYCENENLSFELLREFSHKQELENIFENFRYREDLQDRRIATMQKNKLVFHEINIPWILFWTCHVSCSTKSIVSVGGFDENFQSWGGEDVELALRLHTEGVQFDLAYNCEVIHWPHKQHLNDPVTRYDNVRYIFNKHPCQATYLQSLGSLGWVDIVNLVKKTN
jgi:glycosyltransferase involved in cell wall biosynthesis